MPAKVRKKRGCLRISIFIMLLLIALLIAGEQNLSQTMLDMAYARAYSLAVETINRAVDKVIGSGIQYEDLFDVSMDASGKVSMLRANTIRMTDLATKTALLAEEELNSIENQVIPVPLGSALGVKFLAGFGPKVDVQIIPIGAVNTSFETNFASAGINQTQHKIFMTLRTTVSLIIPTGSQRVEVLSTVPIAENIIVGEVPDSFVDVSDQDDMLNLIP
ncbi:MAG: sporulation protein YunB [Eubacteriales bacterium]|nr:sporulation protein YunB [Eubacteriales bacterium]